MTDQFQELLIKQGELMEQVPHDVRPEIQGRMVVSEAIITSVLEYLGSCGHKPWRPDPLSPEIQRDKLMDAYDYLGLLIRDHVSPPYCGPGIAQTQLRRKVSIFGIMEECLEYSAETDRDKAGPMLEEITDILFFYLELVLLSGFTWPDIVTEYHRKHAVNLERYKRGKEGDYGWDNRGEKEGL